MEEENCLIISIYLCTKSLSLGWLKDKNYFYPRRRKKKLKIENTKIETKMRKKKEFRRK